MEKQLHRCQHHAKHYIGIVNRLTKQEQLFLCMVLSLLVIGWAVKSYRTANPPATVSQTER